MFWFCTSLHFMLTHLSLFQVGPGLVFLLFKHSFLGHGVLMHCVTPVEPLLQCVTHTMFYQATIPPLVPKFILRAESIQVHYTLPFYHPSHCSVLHNQSAYTGNQFPKSCLCCFRVVGLPHSYIYSCTHQPALQQQKEKVLYKMKCIRNANSH